MLSRSNYRNLMHKINTMQIKSNPVSFQPFGDILACRIHVSLAI